VLNVERLLHAPMCDVGSLIYDKDATFLEVGNVPTVKIVDSSSMDDTSGDSRHAVRSDITRMGLEDARPTLIHKMKALQTQDSDSTSTALDAPLQLFAGAAPVSSRSLL
jgi:hypothetical protein